LDINQLVNVLQRASGQTEAGKYFIAGSVYANGAVISVYVPSLSRNATPVSVTLDTADQAPTGGVTGGATTILTGNAGFLAYSLSTTGPNVNARMAGNYTIQY